MLGVEDVQSVKDVLCGVLGRERMDWEGSGWIGGKGNWGRSESSRRFIISHVEKYGEVGGGNADF